MNMGKLLLLIILICSSFSSYGGNSIHGGLLVPATPPCDEIDGVMNANLTQADIESTQITEIIKDGSDPESTTDNSCLPSLKDIAAGIRGSLPSISGSFSSLIDKLKDSACSAVDKAISKSINNQNIVAKLPYGMGQIKAGANTNGQSGIDISTNENKTIYDQAERDLIKIGGNAGRKATENVTDALPNTTGINRTIRDETGKARDVYDENIDGASDAVNNL